MTGKGLPSVVYQSNMVGATRPAAWRPHLYQLAQYRRKRSWRRISFDLNQPIYYYYYYYIIIIYYLD
uniref:Uncharacterized protein n=1 Tax=Musa acuminata subsp. malaccensis TaxID=214687 RepID=A0A804JGV5_MUSAM